MAQLRIPPVSLNFNLKSSVDVHIERAFYGSQWPLLATLARKRHKSTNDDYYKALEVAALSRCDSPVEHTAGREHMQTIINDGTTIKDMDALALYEFAIEGFGMNFASTIGVLRVKLVKASPKDKAIGVRCLELCMRQTDWENAQEIAVLLNKNFPGDRKLLFQMILTTTLAALAENTSETKKKLFPSLAKAQIDRAFNLRPLDGKEPIPSDIDESGILLWLDVRQKFGTAEENLKLLSLPKWNPFVFLERGNYTAFCVALNLLHFNRSHGALVRIGNIILDKVLTAGRNKSNTAARDNAPQGDAIDPITEYMKASQDWSVLMTFTNAATNFEPTDGKYLKILEPKLRALVRLLRSRGEMTPFLEQNFAQFALEVKYTRASLENPSGKLESDSNIRHLVNLCRIYLIQSSSFETIKDYILLLEKHDVVQFVHQLESEGASNSSEPNTVEKLSLTALGLRVRYLRATSLQSKSSPQAEALCEFCNSVQQSTDCETCIKSIATSALETFRLALKCEESKAGTSKASRYDLLSGLTYLGCVCLLKLARVRGGNWTKNQESPLYTTDMQLFLQAVVWLDYHAMNLPRSSMIRVALIKTYLMMGCVSRAFDLWRSLSIKNSLHESLSTFVLDRLASISPGHLIAGPNGHGDLTESILHHFDTALRNRFPDSSIEALRAGNYVQLQDVLNAADRQSRNCVLVLATAEDRRAMRLKHGKNDMAVDDDVLVGSITPKHVLHDFTEYNILQHWEGPNSIPIHEVLAFGPLPTNRRCHLSLSTERFIDIVCYVPPKDLKPPRASQLQHTEWETTILSLGPIHEHLRTLLYGPGQDEGCATDLTGPECWYFRLVERLARLVLLVLEEVLVSPKNIESISKETILAQSEEIVRIITSQTIDFLGVPDGIPAKLQTLHGIAASHAMGMLRDSSLAVKYTVQYISMALERGKFKDNKARGASETAAWLLEELKKLSTAAGVADKHMRDRLKKLTDNVNSSGWVDRLNDWVFGDNAVLYTTDRDFNNSIARSLGEIVSQESREVWAMEVAKSWGNTISGWNSVKFD